MSGLPSPNFGRGNPRQQGSAHLKLNSFSKYNSPVMSAQSNSESGGPWSSNEASYSQPDSPMSPLFKSSPRSNQDFIPLSASSPGGGGGGGGGGSPSARFRGRGRAKWNVHPHPQQRFHHHQHQQSNMSFNNNSGGNSYGEFSGFGSGYSPYNNSRNSFSPRRRVILCLINFYSAVCSENLH